MAEATAEDAGVVVFMERTNKVNPRSRNTSSLHMDMERPTDHDIWNSEGLHHSSAKTFKHGQDIAISHEVKLDLKKQQPIRVL